MANNDVLDIIRSLRDEDKIDFLLFNDTNKQQYHFKFSKNGNRINFIINYLDMRVISDTFMIDIIKQKLQALL
jgi:hypothetical protein